MPVGKAPFIRGKLCPAARRTRSVVLCTVQLGNCYSRLTLLVKGTAFSKSAERMPLLSAAFLPRLPPEKCRGRGAEGGRRLAIAAARACRAVPCVPCPSPLPKRTHLFLLLLLFDLIFVDRKARRMRKYGAVRCGAVRTYRPAAIDAHMSAAWLPVPTHTRLRTLRTAVTAEDRVG